MHRKSDSHFTWIAIAFLHKERYNKTANSRTLYQKGGIAMKNTVIRSRLNPKLEVSLISGHFATRHSHNSHYIDITRMKHEHTMAR